MRLKLKVSYDGRPHDGWQSQLGGNTVQDLLKLALSQTAKEELHPVGSGRTDAGVHALGQVVHVDVPEHLTMNPYNWVPALNTKLPASIRVLECEEVSGEFHARFSATGKCYVYDIETSPILSPFRHGLAWHIPRQLDVTALGEALNMFEGTHDFRGFAANRGTETAETNYERTIFHAGVEATSSGYRVRIEGNGFMYKMVRLLVGGAIHHASGRMLLADLEAILNQAKVGNSGEMMVKKSPVCAPADGLYLARVDYANDA